MKTLAAAALIALGAPAADPVELSAFQALPRGAPTVEIAYGPAPSQAVDLFLPRTKGPHPVAILIHGGCWSVATDDRRQLRHLGQALADEGIAVWSIGYRRANEPGGGYPGTFQDVGAAIDRLPVEAGRYGLDLARTVVVGHSAGGHLALWAAARDALSPASPLYRPAPFMPGRVISLAGVGDLASFSRFVPILCGPGIIDRLIPAGADPYADISPAALPAPPAPVVLVSGVLDRLTPPYVAHDYVRAMRAKAAEPALVDIPGAGHFDLVTVEAPAWKIVKSLIVEALRPTTSPRGR